MFSEDSIQRLRDSLQAGGPLSGPLDVQILPTPRCNAACAFCPTNALPDPLLHHHPRFRMYKDDLPGGLLDRLADDLYHLGGLKRVTITGGEPLLYSHLVPAVFQFVQSFPGAELTLVTNGLRLKRFAHILVMAGLSRLSVSLNAGRADTYRLQNPQASAEAFAEVVEGIAAVSEMKKKLGSNKPHLTVSTVLTRSSAADVPDLFELGRRTGAEAVTFIPLMRLMVDGHEVNQRLRARPEEFARFLDEINQYGERARSEGFFLGYAGTPDDRGVVRSDGLYERQPCYAGFSFAAIFPNGDVRPCCHCEPVMGNLARQSFLEIWRSERYQAFRERMLNLSRERLPGCLCDECGYLYENREFHRGLRHE